MLSILEILPRLLPTSNTKVMAIVSAVLNALRNGYNLLWRILELFVPSFDPTVPIAEPLLTRDSTILEFCQSHLLYFHLQVKKNVFFMARDCTNIFLCAIAPLEYADIVTMIQMSINTYRHPDDGGHLPDQFLLNEIAMLIHNNAKHCVRGIHTPWLNRVAIPEYTWDDRYNSDKPLFCIVQGYCPQVNCIDCQNDRAPHGNRGATPRFGNRYGNRKDRPLAGTPQGRYNRPNQRRRPFKPGVQCAACKQPGHEAANCNMLAIALFINRYTKKELSKTDWTDIEHKWLGCWKEKLGMPAHTPRQVMQTYCDSNNITPEFLNLAMDWDCWPESDLPDSECLGYGHPRCIWFDHMIHAPATPTIPLTTQHNNLDLPSTIPSSPILTNATTKTTAADSKTFLD
jgi:hypothetical protein